MKKIIFSLSFGLVTLLASYSNSVLAQSTNSQNPNTQFQKNEVDSTETGALGNGFNPLDLIHNSNLRRSRGAGEFAEDTNNSLTQEADKFKLLQQQRLQNQSPESKVPSEN